MGDVQISNISLFMEKMGLSKEKVSQISTNLKRILKTTGDIKIRDIQEALTNVNVPKREQARIIDKLADYPGFGTFRPRPR